MKRFAIWSGGFLVLLAAAAFVFGQPIAWVQAGLIIWDIAAGGKPTWWQDITRAPHESVTRWDGGEGDLYAPMPAADARAALVLVPGAAVMGRDEPRLQALARTLARAGFIVLVPELPEVRQLALSRRDADRVAAALREMRRREPRLTLGVAAVSYAVAPAVIAALETNPDFVIGIGGYRDRRVGDPVHHHGRFQAGRGLAAVPGRAQPLRPLGFRAGQRRAPRKPARC